jgi:hypothetical protein
VREREREREQGTLIGSHPLDIYLPEGLLGRRPLNRVPAEHLLHEEDRLLAGVRYEDAEGGPTEAGEAKVHGRGELVALGPVDLLRCPDHRADLEDLVDLALAREQGPEGVKLCHYTPHRPYVDGTVVGRRVEQHLGSSVPESYFVSGARMLHRVTSCI